MGRHEVRRSQSTARPAEEEEAIASGKSSTLSINLSERAPSPNGDEEKTIGVNLDGTEEEISDAARDTDHRHPAKSLRSIRSHHSRAGVDGYTYHHDDEEGPNKSSGGTIVPDSPYLVKFEGDADPLNPRNMTMLRRWMIVLIVSSSSLCVTCASSLYTSTYSQLILEFHTSRLVCTLGLSLFVAGLGTGPMILSPLSEFFGRRPIYICSFTFFLVFMIPCAVARNIQTMLVVRFLDGLAGSAFLSVAGGTVGDMFAKHELSAPMMVYTASPFIGPELGPLVGGFIVHYTTWRWCFYVLIIWSGVQLALIVLFVPETYHPVLLRQKAMRLRKETGNAEWTAPIEKLSRSIPKTLLWSCIRPFQLLIFEPMCLNLCILSAILLGILYLFFGAFPLVFQHNHGFTIWQTGLSFLGLFVGMLTGIASDPFWRRVYDRLVRQKEEQGGASEPEFRLPPTIVGVWVVPVALFGFGWTTYSHYPLYAASALAANSFARSYFAAVFPLFGVQMYNKLGYQWATSLLAFLALTMAPFPILFFRFGSRLRGSSRFASG
ncbi:MFS general substrate transporter [Byssothecium circinans]|uniref:MFS general substrate transporter n=1 Tax=Byssothecium circinans TaxID=147558 RepID=A0A6A5TPY4_9PLEO|nr:MFS general substrate transporter [Byssothecium circinans]